MTLRPIDAAVVVAAQDHNPTILHPSFLEAQGITEHDWKLAAAPLSTPAISVVAYSNGIMFTADRAKLQVVDKATKGSLEGSIAPAVTIRYIQALPHVRYTAVGINLSVLIACEDSERLLIDRFLAPGPWNQGDYHLTSLALNLMYPVPPAVLRLVVDSGAALFAREAEETRGIVIAANYHTDMPSDAAVDTVTDTIVKYGQYCEHFMTLVAKFFGPEVDK